MLLCAVYVVLAVVLLVPSVRSLFSGKVPAPLDGYFLGLSVSYLFPLFTRGFSLYPGDLSGYLGPLVILLMYVFYVAAGSAAVPTFRRKVRRSREGSPEAGSNGSRRALISTVALSLIPVGLGLYLHRRVGVDVLWREVYLYGSAAVREHLQEIGPLAVSLYLLNGLLVYRLAHGWSSRWQGLFTLVIAALWTGVVIFTGEIVLALLVGGVVLMLGCTSQRVVALAVVAIFVSVAVAGYVVSLRVDPGLVRQALDSLRDVWAGSIDKLWVLRWTYERAGLDLLGSSVVPPAQGWKYGVLAYVPKGIVPKRGNDTGHYVASAFAASGTSDVSGNYLSPESFSRLPSAVSVGGPVEALLNLGYFGLFLQGLVYGVFLGLAGAWAKASSDRAFSSLLFVLAASAASTGLYMHLTVYGLTVLGYVLVREAPGPVRSSADEEWFRALSGAGSGEKNDVSPEAADVVAGEPGEARPPGSGPAVGGNGQDSVSPEEIVSPAHAGGKRWNDDLVTPEESQERVVAQELNVREKDCLAGTNGGDEALALAPPRSGSPAEETDEIDLLELLAVLAKRRSLIATVVVAAVAAAFLLSVAMPRRYEVSTTILVRDVPQARTAGVTAQTLAAFAVSDQVLRTVSQDTSLEALRRSFTVKLDSTARVLTLTATADNAGDAFARAQKWLDGFTVEASRLIGVEPPNEPLVKVFVAPSFPERPVSPRLTLNVAVSLLLGLFVGGAAAFALDAVEKVKKRGV